MAEAPKRTKSKLKLNFFKFLKRKSSSGKKGKSNQSDEKEHEVRRATLPPRIEHQQQREDNLNITISSSPQDDFAKSGYYTEIPDRHFVMKLPDVKEQPDNLNKTYLVPIRRSYKSGDSDASDSDGYLNAISVDHGQREVDGVLKSDSDRKAEEQRVFEILQQQAVTDKTLYINYEEPPEIPKRHPRKSPSKEEKSKSLPVLTDAAVGDSLPVNLYENKDFVSPQNGNDEGKTAASSVNGGKDKSVYRSSDFLDNIEADYDKADPPVAKTETKHKDNNAGGAEKIPNGRSTTNLLCIKNISPATTDETLSNYLEVVAEKSGHPMEISNIVHGKAGTVVIQLTEDIGIDGSELHEEMRKRPLDKSVLDACQITRVNSVVISCNHMPADDTISSHFENNFGHVIALGDMESGMKIMTFQDSLVAQKICSESKHTIKDTSLTISLLYECEFGKIWDTKLHQLVGLVRTPCDIQVKGTDTLLESFIRSNESLVRHLNDTLKTNYATISVGLDLVIKCTLSETDTNFQYLAGNWESRVREAWKKCLEDAIGKEELDIPGNISERVLQYKQTIEPAYKNAIMVVVNEKLNVTSLNIVGLKQPVKKFVLELKSFVEKMETNSSSKSLQKTETDSSSKTLQKTETDSSSKTLQKTETSSSSKTLQKTETSSSSRTLQITSYHINLLEADDVINVVKTEENVAIEIKSIEGKIIIKGDQQNIDAAEMQIRKAISGFRSWILDNYSTDHIKLLQNHSVLSAIKLHLKDKGVKTEFEFKDDRLIVHANTAGSLDFLKKVINENIDQHIIPLDENSLTILFLSEWKDFVNELMMNDCFGTVIIRTDDSGNIVLTSVKDKHADVLRRTQEIIARLEIQKDIAENNDKSLYEQLAPATHRNIYQTLDTRAPISGDKAAEKKGFVTAKRHIQVIIEEIPLTKKKVDVMACAASCDLDFRYGQLLRSIQKDGGKMLEEECKNKYPNGIEPGKIAVVKAGNLPCSQLYLGYLPQYRSDHKSAEKALTTLVFDCLTTASKNGNSTIAFPSLGTGNRGYPHSVAAKLVFKAIKDFDKKIKSTTLHEIFLVILPSDKASLQAFRCEELGQK